MILTEHFSYDELTQSSTAMRMGINNTPGAIATVNLQALAEGLEHVRELLNNPIHIDDAFRCEALEKVLAHNDFIGWCSRHEKPVNAASWSEYFAGKQHPKGFAADFICPQFGTPEQIVKAIMASAIEFDQVIMEGTWVHIGFAPEMRRIAKAATFVNGIPSYTALA